MSTPLVSSSSSSSSVAFFHPSSSFHHHQPASSPLLPITRTRIIKKAWPVIKCELCDEQQQLASSSSSSKVKRADEELAALINITGGKKDVDDEKAQEGGDGSKEEEEVDATAGAMINFIKGYKQLVSPLLPPACRFLPTCSEYAIDSIKEFGPLKGGILTVWRILRCNPLGGRGYDPPRWPPPPFNAGSY